MKNSISNSNFSDGTFSTNQFVGTEREFGKRMKIDEKKVEDASNIQSINIESMVDVFVSTSYMPNIEVYFHGEAVFEKFPIFEVCNKEGELRITVKWEGSYFNANANLCIILPQKKFEKIIAEGTSSDFSIIDGVIVNSLSVNTESGDIDIEAQSNVYSVETGRGNVDICAEADGKICVEVNTTRGNVSIYTETDGDINVEVNTVSGDIFLNMENIASINLNACSKSGRIKNEHKGKIGHTAYIYAYTRSGDIRIK